MNFQICICFVFVVSNYRYEIILHDNKQYIQWKSQCHIYVSCLILFLCCVWFIYLKTHLIFF